MKRKQLLALSAFFVLDQLTLAEVRVPPGGPRDYVTLAADIESPMVFRQRFLLEQRRAGGPRGGVVQELLATGLRANSPDWGMNLLASCRGGVVDCGRYVEAAQEWAARQPSGLRASSEGQAAAIKQEGEIQGMTLRERHELYSTALRKGPIRPTDLDAGDAARRAIREGMTGLFGQIDEVTEGQSSMRAIRRELLIARALGGRDPDGALLSLVTRGAEADVAWCKASRDVLRRGLPQPKVPDTEVSTAKLALDSLRKRNATVVKELRRILQLYEAETPRLARRVEAVSAEQETDVTQDTEKGPGQISEFGLMGWEVIEVIGDLGDREVERHALGAGTLWDQVNLVEQKLIEERKLSRSAVIATK